MLKTSKDNTRSKNKPFSNRMLIIGSIIIVTLVLAWGSYVSKFFGYPLHLVSDASGLHLLKQYSHLGSSFGPIAALFAGIAAILLAFNLRLQQSELSEMRMEMDRDRRLREFIFLLNEFDWAKMLATHMTSRMNFAGNGVAFSDTQMPGHRYIFKTANNYIQKRLGGDYHPTTDIAGFRNQHDTAPNDGHELRYDHLLPLYTSGKEIARFLSGKAPAERKRLLPLFESSATAFALMVLHEYILISDDNDFRQHAENSCFFSRLKRELHEALQGGPALGDGAYE